MDFSIFDELLDGVLVIGLDYKIVYANHSAKKLLDVKENDFCKGLFSICNSCPLKLVLEERESVQVYDIKTNTDVHACWSMSPLFNGDKCEGVVEVFKDVSNVVSCILESQRQKTYKETILNSIVEAILVLDENGYIVEHNNIAKKMLCRTSEESLIGRHIKELVNLSLEEFPPQGERTDVYIETPCGRQKASTLVSPMNLGFGYVVSFYVIQQDNMSFCDKLDYIFTKSPTFQKVLDLVKSCSEHNVNVLIEGETGTGKSLLAKYIHLLSPRRDAPFVKVNCAAIPENLLEAELFGYVKGAFTGATKDKPGKAEIADGGTLFLDEIGDMPLSLQAKILHLVEEKEFERLGSNTPRKTNIRIIASTNKDIKELMRQGRFREDLYYRLSVVNIYLPPLRERKEDIPLLINNFIEKYSKLYLKRVKSISGDAIKMLLGYDFPGNIRELEHIIEKAIITCRGSIINIEDISLDFQSNNHKQQEEKERIKAVLEKVNYNKSLAAKMLGIHRTTLWRKLKELGIG